ncbi:phosphatase PAP2 family protein, partial [Streptomyces sp. B1866]|uniref:phosphatase PAP2 family protein n=1 Tax=Streptomyces sp. B1866 TaxID=3075431 RepID=UPI00288F23FF
MTWFLASAAALVLMAAGLPGVPGLRRRHPLVPVVLREAGIASAVFLVWQMPTRMAAGHRAAATDRALWIHRVQRAAGLPDEAGWQRAVLPYPWLVQTANWYYAVMHFGVMAAFLVWLFWRHRPAYARVRTTVVLVTSASLAVQLVAVAPPRLLPRLGYVDTAVRYGQSVYRGGPGSVVADELSAVPSVHVAWALLVAVTVVRVGRGRPRWLAVAHPVLTVVVVVVTANHFWFDAIAAALLLALCAGAQAAVRRLAPGAGRRAAGLAG